MVFLEAGKGGSSLPSFKFLKQAILKHSCLKSSGPRALSFFSTSNVLIFPIMQPLLNFEQSEVIFLNKMKKKKCVKICVLAHILPFFVLGIFVSCLHKVEKIENGKRQKGVINSGGFRYLFPSRTLFLLKLSYICFKIIVLSM